MEVDYIEAHRYSSRIVALCTEAGNLMWFYPRYNTAYPSPKSPLLNYWPTVPDRVDFYGPDGESWGPLPKVSPEVRAEIAASFARFDGAK